MSKRIFAALLLFLAGCALAWAQSLQQSTSVYSQDQAVHQKVYNCNPGGTPTFCVTPFYVRDVSDDWTDTPTFTFTITPTPTVTGTFTPTPTVTNTFTSTTTATRTYTPTPTGTPAPVTVVGPVDAHSYAYDPLSGWNPYQYPTPPPQFTQVPQFTQIPYEYPVATAVPVVATVPPYFTAVPQFTQIPQATPDATKMANASFQLTQIAQGSQMVSDLDAIATVQAKFTPTVTQTLTPTTTYTPTSTFTSTNTFTPTPTMVVAEFAIQTQVAALNTRVAQVATQEAALVNALATLTPIVQITGGVSLTTSTASIGNVGLNTGTNTIGNAGISFVMPTTDPYTEANINFNTTGDQTIVSGTASQTVRVFRMWFETNGACTLNLKDGASVTFGGPMTMLVGGCATWDLTNAPWFTTTSGNGFVINSDTAVQVSGRVYYQKN